MQVGSQIAEIILSSLMKQNLRDNTAKEHEQTKINHRKYTINL